MSRKHYLLGISLAALAASGAHAQSTNSASVNVSGVNNDVDFDQTAAQQSAVDIGVVGDRNFVRATQVGSRHDSKIDITGSDNSATTTQSGFENDADVTVSGDFNNASVTQRVGYNDAAITQNGGAYESSATITQDSSSSSATVTQTGSSYAGATITQGRYNSEYTTTDSTATISQTGSGNSGSATIDQTGSNSTASIGQAGVNSEHGATLWQFVSNSTASISQDGDAGVNSGSNSGFLLQGNGNSNAASLTQTGSNQGLIFQGNGAVATGVTASVTQTGSSNIGQVLQGDSVNTPYENFGGSNSAGFATVSQTGTGNTAIAFQNGNSNTASITTSGSGNFARSDQAANASLSEATSNVSGTNNSSRILQQDDLNEATAFVGGDTLGGGDANTSRIDQGGDNNVAFASVGRTANNLPAGSQQSSDIFQRGSSNNADVTLFAGLAGTNPGNPNLPGGNTADIDQVGSGSTAFVVAGATIVNGVAQPLTGFGNSTTINQTSTAAFEAGEGARSTVWQQGRFARAGITQTDNADAGNNYGDGSTARAEAGVYQAGLRFQADINQTGDNLADITQGIGAFGTINVTQTDAGDDTQTETVVIEPERTETDAFGNVTVIPAVTEERTTAVRLRNQAVLVQYGDNNQFSVTQNTKDGSVTGFQKAGSSGNDAGVEQGTGATATTGFSPAPQVLSGTPQTGADTRELTASVTQEGANNGARIRQDGVRLAATIDQAGTGTALNASSFDGNYFTDHAGNIVQISQQGSDNTASAKQTANVGRSGSTAPASGSPTLNAGGPDTYYFAGGARSPEILILQGGTFNDAFAEQRGKGQYARIEQSGSSNEASILQDVNATNATAVIIQTGSNNSYSVTQTQAGQYISVTQTGNNNASTNIVQRGPLN